MTYFPANLSSDIDERERLPIDRTSVDVFAPLNEAIQAEAVLASRRVGHLLLAERQQADGTLVGLAVAVLRVAGRLARRLFARVLTGMADRCCFGGGFVHAIPVGLPLGTRVAWAWGNAIQRF